MAQTQQQSHPGFVSMRQDIERRVRLYNESQTLFGSGGGLMTLTIGEGISVVQTQRARGRRTSARGHRRSTASTLQPVAVQASGTQQARKVSRGARGKLKAAATARWNAIRQIRAQNPSMTLKQAQAQYKQQHAKAA